MDTHTKPDMENTEEKPLTLLPLNEGGPNEEVANLLAELIGGDTSRAATSAMIILAGLQAYLETGTSCATASYWKPLIVSRKLKQDFGGQAYKCACEIVAKAKEEADTATNDLYSAVCQILIGDPEQEKIVVDAGR